MFSFRRNGSTGTRKARQRPHGRDGAPAGEDKLPERPSLDGYHVYELPEPLSVPLLKAFKRDAP